MKQCPKCAWRAYNYTEPICDRVRQILHNTDIANEIFEHYKDKSCLYFINRKQKGTTYTTIEEGQNSYFDDLINEYKEIGCSKRVYVLRHYTKPKVVLLET